MAKTEDRLDGFETHSLEDGADPIGDNYFSFYVDVVDSSAWFHA